MSPPLSSVSASTSPAGLSPWQPNHPPKKVISKLSERKNWQLEGQHCDEQGRILYIYTQDISIKTEDYCMAGLRYTCFCGIFANCSTKM